MKCPVCRANNRIGVRFCEECGQALPKSVLVSLAKKHRATEGGKPVVDRRARQAVRRIPCCPSCGNVNRGGIQFCEQCGQSLPANSQLVKEEGKARPSSSSITGFACHACGHTNRSNVVFCEECGTRLNGVVAQRIFSTPRSSLWKPIAIFGGIALASFGLLLFLAFGLLAAGSFVRPSSYPTEMGALILATETISPQVVVPTQVIDQATPTQVQGLTLAPTEKPTSLPATQPVQEQTVLPAATELPEPPAMDYGTLGVNPDNSPTTFGLTGGAPSDWIDYDEDGLDDYFETDIANAYYPYLQFSMYEKTDIYSTLMRLYQVTPLNPYTSGDYQGPYGLLLTYVITYPKDDGIISPIGADLPEFISHNHWGDTETFRMVIVQDPHNGLWTPVMLLIKRHFDTPERYYPGDFEWSGTHPWVWVSANKHGMYSSFEECVSYKYLIYPFEACDTSEYVASWGFTIGSDGNNFSNHGFNVGERGNPIFESLLGNSFGLYENEFVWSSEQSQAKVRDNLGNAIDTIDLAEKFCGGYDPSDRSDCASGFNNKWWPLPYDEDPENPFEVTLPYLLSSYAEAQYIVFWGAQYKVTVFTGNVDHAGTNLTIDLTLTGDQGSYTKENLDTPGNSFETGSVEVIDIGARELGNLSSLKIQVYWPVDSPHDSEWFLQKVVVENLRNGSWWTFNCNCWLDQDAHYDSEIGQNTYGNTITISP